MGGNDCREEYVLGQERVAPTGVFDQKGFDMDVDVWVDPVCPFCWVTVRWLFEEVEPNRDVDLRLRSISLLQKNRPDEDSPYHEKMTFTNRLLRVMESVRASEGDQAAARLYWEFGSRIHHDKDRDFDPADALATIGLDSAHAAAFSADKWDDVIRDSMAEGLALTGDDVGTPIVATVNSDGEKVGYFGPVLTSVPSGEKGLALWDALVAMMDIDSFYELKRTRSDSPDPGERPAPR